LTKIQKILQFIDSQKISISEFERKSGISNAYLKNTVDRGADVTFKILDKIRQNNPDDYYKIFPKENANRETSVSIVEEDQASYSQSVPVSAVVSMIESNRILSEAHYTLVKNIDELIQLYKQAVAHDAGGTIATAFPRLSDLLELLAEIGSGKRWGSKKEALAELNKFVSAPGKTKKEMDTQRH